MSSGERKFDVVLWGATGFTGRLVAEYLMDQYQQDDLTWSIAGRNEEKLRQLRNDLQSRDENGQKLPMLIGEAHDPDRMRSIARRTKVVCSTVGPYAQYGTPLVQACVEEGTDYCDLTGEAQWMRRMIDRFHESAKDRGIRIVHACGFDAVPSDLGTLMVQNRALDHHGAPCDDMNVLVHAEGGSVSGGTVASMLHMFEEASGNRQLQDLLDNPYGLVPGREDTEPSDSDATNTRSDPGTGDWTIPFPMEMINRKVVHRTNFLLDDPWTRSFRYRESVPMGDGLSGAVSAACGRIGLKLLKRGLGIRPIRELLKTWVLPVPGQGPDRGDIEQGSFRMSFLGRGTRDTLGSSFQVQGSVSSNLDPGYGSTARILGKAAVCLAREHVDSPVNGGVLTPASGIGMPLIDHLQTAGMSWLVNGSEVRVG